MDQTANLPSDSPAPLPFGSAGAGAASADEPAADDTPAAADMPGSRYAAMLARGFWWMRFSHALEARFQTDKAPERLKLARLGAIAAVALSNGMLITDWLMVPDQFANALRLRLLVHTPLLLVWLACFHRMSSHQREWFGLTMSISAGVITAFLCVNSTDALGPAYLVSLAMILLFNGGVVRMRFWIAVAVDVILLGVYAVALCLLAHPQPALMVAITLVQLSTTVFTLYNSYWLEHDERVNWLMLQHEYSLLDALQQGNQRLDAIARHDPLTSLANRRHVDEFLQQVWDRARLSGDEIAVLMMDIDHFKAFNDHYGHPAGDACLKDVAEALGQHLRQPGDLVGRYGGEEFMAVLHKTGLPAAQAAAERVRAGVQQLARVHAASPTGPHVTMSIGVACVRPDQCDSSPARLIELADEALYQAKSHGRNQVHAALDRGTHDLR
jgi:diguanylate cyclase (GGDEF)-like protein